MMKTFFNSTSKMGYSLYNKRSNNKNIKPIMTTTKKKRRKRAYT